MLYSDLLPPYHYAALRLGQSVLDQVQAGIQAMGVQPYCPTNTALACQGAIVVLSPCRPGSVGVPSI